MLVSFAQADLREFGCGGLGKGAARVIPKPGENFVEFSLARFRICCYTSLHTRSQSVKIVDNFQLSPAQIATLKVLHKGLLSQEDEVQGTIALIAHRKIQTLRKYLRGISKRDRYIRGKGTFDECEIYGNRESGVSVDINSNSTVRNSLIRDNGRFGISIRCSSGGIFENNTLSGNASGNWHLDNPGEIVRIGNTNDDNAGL